MKNGQQRANTALELGPPGAINEFQDQERISQGIQTKHSTLEVVSTNVQTSMQNMTDRRKQEKPTGNAPTTNSMDSLQ